MSKLELKQCWQKINAACQKLHGIKLTNPMKSGENKKSTSNMSCSFTRCGLGRHHLLMSMPLSSYSKYVVVVFPVFEINVLILIKSLLLCLFLIRDTPKFLDIMNDEVNNDDGVKCAAKETAQRLLRSKKAKQVQQLTNAASQAVAQLGYGDSNLHGTAKDVAWGS